jgi:hypothetical protein
MQTDSQLNGIGRLLREREAADFLGFSLRGLIDLRNAGKVPFIRLGRSIRYRPESIRALLEKLEIGGGK